MTTEDVEDSIYHQLEDTTHLLHGVVHTNGFGHLLRVNGREGGSGVLSGSHIMDFWDRLCKLLGVRLELLVHRALLAFCNESDSGISEGLIACCFMCSCC